MNFLQRLGCAWARHPNKRIAYWLVKPEPGGFYSSGWTGNPFAGLNSGPTKGAAFAVIDFECPDCKRTWHTELS